jgi:hypothetical protein
MPLSNDSLLTFQLARQRGLGPIGRDHWQQRQNDDHDARRQDA